MTDTRSVAQRDLDLAREFARRLAEKCDPQLFHVTLFGSRAKGYADDESDLDLFVALDRDDPNGEVEEIARRIACDLTLEHGVVVSPFVADRTFLEQHRGFSFLETVEEEGVPM